MFLLGSCFLRQAARAAVIIIIILFCQYVGKYLYPVILYISARLYWYTLPTAYPPPGFHIYGLCEFGEWCILYTNIEERACDLAEYIIENKATVRAAAKQFNISKSTVHKDLTERLKTVSPALYHQVRELLDINKAERHIRGGMATRRKYKGETA